MDDPACLIWASLAAARVGMRRESLHHANRAVSYAREQGAMTTLPFSLQVQAAALIAESRVELAYASSDEGWRLALDTGQVWAAGWNLMRLVQIDALRGEEELLRAHAAELQDLVARSGAAAIGQHAERSLALLDLCLGRPAEALERLLPIISDAYPDPTRCSCTECPTPSRRPFAPIASTRSRSTPTDSSAGPSSLEARRASRCSLAAGR